MTTVDVTITAADNSRRLSLHNGLFGPATSALHALAREFQNGTLIGPWNVADIDTIAPGTVVRRILAAVNEHDPEFRGRGREAFTAFRAAVDDNSQYRIRGLEV